VALKRGANLTLIHPIKMAVLVPLPIFGATKTF
jgi:hypothetical protein